MLSGLAMATRTRASRPTGTFNQNTARQLIHSVSAPPMSGPTARKIWETPAYTAMARPRSVIGKASITIFAETGIISAAPTPWAARAARIQVSPPPPGARPQNTDAAKNVTTPRQKQVTGPSRSPSLPPRATHAAIAST